MTITVDIRQQVRQRAGCACEFCGVTEESAASELTIDHYQPQAKGGSDDLENLVYSCPKCNNFKSDYWPVDDQPALWNPRVDPATLHFIEAEDGLLYPLTATGRLTVERLRLNRPQLVNNRRQRAERAKELMLLQRANEMVLLLENTNREMSLLMDEQRTLLKEQRDLLRLLLRRR
jgi:hypothetical protein